MLSSAPCRKAAEHHKKKHCRSQGRACSHGRAFPELCAWGREQGGSLSCGREQSKRSAHIQASPRNLCMPWLEAPCQELGEKQTAPCMLPACSCIQHRATLLLWRSKEHSGKTISLAQKSSGNGCPQWLQTMRSPQCHASQPPQCPNSSAAGLGVTGCKYPVFPA